jgi:hypothetical protein
MAEKTPDPDSGARLHEQVRRIVVEEGGACLGNDMFVGLEFRTADQYAKPK